jgi:hypothetical protein
MSANNQTQGQRGRPQTNQVNPTGVDQNQVQLNSDMGVGTQTPTGAESGSPTSSKGFGNTPTSSKSATQHFKVSEFAFNTTESIVGDARGLTSQTDILTELYFGLTKGATSMTQNSTQNLIGNIVDVIYPQKVQNPIFIGSNQSPKSACSSSEVHKLITRRVKAKKSRGEKTGSDVRSEAEVKSDVSSTTMLKHSRPVREMSNVFLNSTLSSAELGVKASSLSDTLYRGAGRGVGLLGGGLVGSTLGGIGGNIAGSGLGAGIGTLLNHLQGNPYNLAPGEGAITGAQLGGALGNMAGTVGGGVLGGAKGYQMAGTYMDAKEKPKSKGQTDLSRSEDDKSRDELEAQWLKHHYEYDGKKPGKGPITARELD